MHVTQEATIIGWIVMAIGAVLAFFSPRVMSVRGVLGAVCLAAGVYTELAYFLGAGK